MQISFEQQDIDMIITLIDERIKAMLSSVPSKSNSHDECFLTIEAAADFLSVKKNWLYNNHEKEGIPVYKIGGLKFKKSDLLKWATGKVKY